ncbi:MAG: hypothetical protein L6N94_01575 [Candidatus Methylarchaceae archaeon HK01M]|nr:hypothetical protein [Candidatus Methylarchaceae archaeon HK01M]
MELDKNSVYCQYKEGLCPVPTEYPSGSGLFFAYPSRPVPSAEAIQGAIELLSKDTTVNVGLIDWKDLPIEGNIIFCEICKGIRKSSCVVLNQTDTNFNVLFEYGYAIGAGRAIWPLVEEGVAKEDRIYTSLDTLTTIGYSGFTNSKSIHSKMLKKKPWERESHFDLPEPLGKDATRETLSLLYLQSPQDNEASLRITEAILTTQLGIIIDDPREVSFHPMSWYLKRLKECYAVVVHLGNERMEGYALHWAKCALVAGISLALGRRLLILGENISMRPIDYRDIMKTYNSASGAAQATRDFLSPISNIIFSLRRYMESDITAPKQQLELKEHILSVIDLGDYIAENEEIILDKYFVETPQFLMALEPEFKVFVGRKGSGKTANFYMIMNKLLYDKRNLVCNIKPKEWQLNEFLQFTAHQLDKAKQGYLLESLWKFMIYSEVLKSCYERIKVKPAAATFSTNEMDIRKYVEDRIDIYQLSFTSRLVKTVNDLIRDFDKEKATEIAVSEILHENDIRQIHTMIMNYIQENTEKCTIVLDGLDSNWYLGENYQFMAEILLALISSARDIWRMCTRDCNKREINKGISIFIFLRNDVFKVVLAQAKEPDKLQYELLLWDKFEKLFEIVNKRISNSLADYDIEPINWTEILEPEFTPKEMKTFVKDNVVWRPRDIIYLMERAFYYARSRRAKYLGKQDFDIAMPEYSEHVFRSLIAESQPYIPSMENLILEFAEAPAIMDLEAVKERLIKAKIKTQDIRKTINFLIESSFIGYGIGNHDYRFPITPTESSIIAKAVWNGKTLPEHKKFKIHNAFHHALSIN